MVCVHDFASRLHLPDSIPARVIDQDEYAG